MAASGLQVEIVDGFATRSHGDLPDAVSIVWHHDASPIGPTGQWLSGEWDAGHPSAQIWVDYTGKWWFIGAGQAYHAGAVASGMPNNSNSVGIETDHTDGEDWGPGQLESLQKGTAAIMIAKAMTSDALHFHKTIAFPPGRKHDPSFPGVDPMDQTTWPGELTTQRAAVQGIITAGGGPATPTTPNIKDANGTVINPGTSVAPDVFKEGVFSYLYMGTALDSNSLYFRGDLAPINDQQLISTVQAIVTASLRSFMSGPDGSFIAFFPDYFGIYSGEDNYKLTLEDIELVDFKIDVNDDELATDVFVTGQTLSAQGEAPDTVNWLESNGVVNIRQSSAMALILGDAFADSANFDPTAFYAKFGLRPLKSAFPAVHVHLLEYLQALTLFQRKWAAQYRTQVQFTFMPELYPGMRILIRSHNVTVFVEEVVHTGSFETGFSTSATISSPAAINGGGIAGMVVGQI